MANEQNDEVPLQCYNRSCGKTFLPSQNTADSCNYHPGVPVFHDVYKKWSCCDKKTTDFTEFLNIKGCTKSYHSNVKPLEPEKPKQPEIECDKNEVYTYSPPKPLSKVGIVRPDANSPLKRLKITVGSSLKPLLEKLQKVVLEDKSEKSNEVPLNTACKNGGCKNTYLGEQSNEETCIYHSGIPVFHEGLKFWTCCAKRTTDFDSFLEQVGCTTGKHVWFKDENSEEKRAACRYDWHQTGNSVVVSVYSKLPIPDLSHVEANPVKLNMHIEFGEQRKVFEQEILLFGVIDVEKSSVSYLGSKVEINLKKAEPQNWSNIAFSNKSGGSNSVLKERELNENNE